MSSSIGEPESERASRHTPGHVWRFEIDPDGSYMQVCVDCGARELIGEQLTTDEELEEFGEWVQGLPE